MKITFQKSYFKKRDLNKRFKRKEVKLEQPVFYRHGGMGIVL